jgi:hypothetical protein
MLIRMVFKLDFWIFSDVSLCFYFFYFFVIDSLVFSDFFEVFLLRRIFCLLVPKQWQKKYIQEGKPS